MLAATYTGPLGTTGQDVQAVLRAAPAMMATAVKYVNQVAAVAPRAVPVVDYIIPLLQYGPMLSPLARSISGDLADALKKAPQYKSTLRTVSRMLNDAPKTARQVSAVAGKVSGIVQKIGADPALDEFVDRAVTLVKVAQGPSKPKPAQPAKPGAPGVGLRKAIPAMDAAIWTAQNKWALIAVPSAILVFVGAVGYRVGRKRALRG